MKSLESWIKNLEHAVGIGAQGRFNKYIMSDAELMMIITGRSDVTLSNAELEEIARGDRLDTKYEKP